MTLAIGTLLDGRYQLEKVLGAGGMGEVFQAEHVRIGKKVAVKILYKHLSSAGDSVKRFEIEARAAAKAGSSHIVDVFDFGTTPEGDHFLVMELLRGETLKDRIARRGGILPERETIALFKQVLRGLEKAHSAHIIHRDLKPDNVFIVTEHADHKDWIKILDFGICRLLGSDQIESITQQGMLLGTPLYMSPEHVLGSHNVTVRSDIYSVASMMYRALAGKPPFTGGNVTEIMMKVATTSLPEYDPLLGHVSPGLRSAVKKGMARNPVDRFSSAEEFEDALARLDSSYGGYDVQARAPSWAGAGQSQPPPGYPGLTPDRSLPAPGHLPMGMAIGDSGGFAAAGQSNSSQNQRSPVQVTANQEVVAGQTGGRVAKTQAEPRPKAARHPIPTAAYVIVLVGAAIGLTFAFSRSFGNNASDAKNAAASKDAASTNNQHAPNQAVVDLAPSPTTVATAAPTAAPGPTPKVATDPSGAAQLGPDNAQLASVSALSNPTVPATPIPVKRGSHGGIATENPYH